MIQEVTTKPTTAAQNKKLSKSLSKQQAQVAKTATARCEIHEILEDNRVLCKRVPGVEKLGKALSPEILHDAGNELEVAVLFETPVRSTDDVELELGPELLCVKAIGHHDLSTWRC